MKTFIADIIPKIKKYSRKLDELTLLTNQHWVVLDELEDNSSRSVYIFRSNNELLIAKNGKVQKAKWEYLGNNSLLIDIKDESYLFKHGFFDENVLALKIDGSEEYAILINESKYEGELNSITRVLDFLRITYIEPAKKAKIETLTKKEIKPEKKQNITPKDTPYQIGIEDYIKINEEEYTYKSKMRELVKSCLIYFILTFLILLFIFYLNYS